MLQKTINSPGGTTGNNSNDKIEETKQFCAMIFRRREMGVANATTGSSICTDIVGRHGGVVIGRAIVMLIALFILFLLNQYLMHIKYM